MIPDHIVPLTLDELQYKNRDAILNYTLNLIGEDSGKPAQSPEDPGMPSWVWFVIIGGILILYFVSGNRRVLKNCGRKKDRRPLKHRKQVPDGYCSLKQFQSEYSDTAP